jgi:hypothetical protein
VIKKVLLLSSIGALALVAAPAALASPHIGGCTLNGTADFNNPLTANIGASGPTNPAFTYSFSGTLSNCLSSSSIPTSGTVTAGKQITINGVLAQEPTASGNGGCVNSTTNGIAIVQWTGGAVSVIKYNTTGAAAAVALTGSVIPSVTLPIVNPTTGGPTTTTVNSTAFSGDSAGGALAFEPPDPTACNAAGVTSAGIQGEIGTGSQS